MIPLSKPFLGKEEYKAAVDALKSGWLIHGPKNEEFEEQFAKYIGVRHAVSLNSCASALQLAIEAQGIKGEVILPSFTHMASANAIVRSGAKPVFADIDYKTCNLDPDKAKALITPRTEAIMVVHFAGQSANLDAFRSMCKKHNLALIEDSAENCGGKWGSARTGSVGTGCFSFFPAKNMTTAEGGMLTTNDSDIAQKARTIAGHGVVSSFLSREKMKKFWVREAVLPGLNFRMSNVQAAIGIEQLKKLDVMNNLRRRNADLLTSLIKKMTGVELPYEHPKAYHVYQMYAIKVPSDIRDPLLFELRKEGVGASAHFDPPVHEQPYYRDRKFKNGQLSVTENVSKSIITMPMYPGMSEAIVKEVAKYFNKAFKSASSHVGN